MNRDELLRDFIERGLGEDTGEGDYSSIACIPPDAKGKARLIIKEYCIVSGLEVAQKIFRYAESTLITELFLHDGDEAASGTIGFIVSGNLQAILKSERFVLNVLQRMSGIATTTKAYVKKLEGLNTKVLDTRKTTPGMRFLEKEAVRTGGGENHRMGLYDLILLKDNHIDYAGGIEQAIFRTHDYLMKTGKKLKIEIEARNIEDIKRIMKTGGVDRIMLDNFTIPDTLKAVGMIAGRFETESSGGITLNNIREYAECGVDYISVGALTNHIKIIDMSLKAVKDV